MTDFGEKAYIAYCVAVGGKAWNGDPLPTWEVMTEDSAKQHLVSAWRTAGLEAAKAFVLSIRQSWDDADRMMEGAGVAKIAIEHGEDVVSALGKGYGAILMKHAEAEGILIQIPG